jgi:carboxymethylenebutenolidase
MEAGFLVHELVLSGALADDRREVQEIDEALSVLASRAGVGRERLGVVGFGRGGTLAFLLGCTRRVGAVVDLDGPVLYPELSAGRPIQPLELALNLEGSFLGVFSGPSGPVGEEEITLLRERLSSAARPFDIVVGPRVLDEGLWPRLLAFLRQSLVEPED